jgi:hypothetical protein
MIQLFVYVHVKLHLISVSAVDVAVPPGYHDDCSGCGPPGGELGVQPRTAGRGQGDDADAGRSYLPCLRFFITGLSLGFKLKGHVTRNPAALRVKFNA